MFYLRKNQLQDPRMIIIKLLEVHGFAIYEKQREGFVDGSYRITIGRLINIGRDINVEVKPLMKEQEINNLVIHTIAEIKNIKRWLKDRMEYINIEELTQANVDSVVKEINSHDIP